MFTFAWNAPTIGYPFPIYLFILPNYYFFTLSFSPKNLVEMYFSEVPQFQLTGPGIRSRALLWVWAPQSVKSKISDLQDKATVHHTARWWEVTVTVQGTTVQIVHALQESPNLSITALYSTVSKIILNYKTQTQWPLQCLAWGNT